MEPIQTLFSAESSAHEAALPEGLRALYDGDLYFDVYSRAAGQDRPYVIANFVSTLDGVASFNLPGQMEGKQISGANEGDRFIMGLLRASSDAIMVGSGTIKASGTTGVWTPESVYPPAKELYWQYRRDVLKKEEYPLVVIVSGTGQLDLSSAVFHRAGHSPGANVLVITSEEGRQRLEQSGSGALGNVTVRVLPAGDDRVSARAILTNLKQEWGVGLLLSEGGPTLFGELLEKGLVDEFFLTMAPQFAGRTAASPRPGLVENIAFNAQTAPWLKLLTAKQAGDFMYLRYRSS